jgi:hypothetical protein
VLVIGRLSKQDISREWTCQTAGRAALRRCCDAEVLAKDMRVGGQIIFKGERMDQQETKLMAITIGN